jgi:DNA/RNA endonuclease YhcR with UshA esterase domain
MALILMATLTGCGGSNQAQAADDAAAAAAAEAAAAGYVLSAEAGKHLGEEATVMGTVRDYSYLAGRTGKPVILLFDVPGIVNRGSSISDLETPASFKAIIYKEDAKNFPSNFAASYVGKTVCVTGMIEDFRDDASISVKEPSQIVVGC